MLVLRWFIVKQAPFEEFLFCGRGLIREALLETVGLLFTSPKNDAVTLSHVLVIPGRVLVIPGHVLVLPGCVLVIPGCILVIPGRVLVIPGHVLVIPGYVLVISGHVLVISASDLWLCIKAVLQTFHPPVFGKEGKALRFFVRLRPSCVYQALHITSLHVTRSPRSFCSMFTYWKQSKRGSLVSS